MFAGAFRLVFLMAILISPVYVFESGNPQPTDFVMLVGVVAAVLAALAERRQLNLFILPVPWVALTCWTFLLNGVLMAVYASSDFLWHPLFWFYNFLAATVCVHFLLWNEHDQRLMVMAVAGALLVSTAGVAIDVAGGGGVRITSFFNNPNQLAYFSLCALGTLVVLRDFKIGSPLVLAAFVGGCVSILAAASLGALAGACAIIAALIWANGVSPRKLMSLTLAIVLIAAVVLAADGFLGGALERNLLARMERVDTKVEVMYDERGYDRIFDYPQYNLFGAGEALHNERFGAAPGHEIHSSFGSLLFNYGIIGLGLFLTLLYAVLRRAPFAAWLVMAAPLTYSITHMGLRFTMFWILLAVIHWRYNLCKSPVPIGRKVRPVRHEGARGGRRPALAGEFPGVASRSATRPRA